MNKYIIGTSPLPEWCQNCLMPYIKSDGSTGWEYHTTWYTLDLKQGDMLVKKNGRVEVKFSNEYR